MNLEVNRVEPAPTTPAAVAEEAAPAPGSATISGTLRRCRAGWARALEIITGLALLRWLGLGAATLVGYRHEVRLSLRGSSLDLEGERRLLGIALGHSRRVVPLGEVQRASLVGASSTWALIAGAAAVTFCTTAAGVLILWGIRGRQPSWIAFAVLLLGLGGLLDAAAYLWVRHNIGLARATVDIVTRRDRIRVSGTAQRAAGELLDKIAAQFVREARS